MIGIIRPILRLFVGQYALNHIYYVDLPVSEPDPVAEWQIRPITSREKELIDRSPDQKLRKSNGFDGPGATGFVLMVNNEPCTTCWFHNPLLYGQQAMWTIASDEAALVDLVTAEHYRGRNMAPYVIAMSGNVLANRGFRRLMAWIWWSNTPSRRAFEKAGWKKVAFVAQFNPWWTRSIRLCFKSRENSHYNSNP